MNTISFDTTDQLTNLLEEAPDGAVLVNKPLLSESSIPERNLAVGVDFDGTAIHFNNQLTHWQEVRRPERRLISDAGRAEMVKHYRRWGRDRSKTGQKMWADETYHVYHNEGVTRQNLIDLGKLLDLRNGFTQLVGTVIANTGALAVVTYGMDTVVEACLGKTGFAVVSGNRPTSRADSIFLYAETIAFESHHPFAVITERGVRPRSGRVLGYNKHLYMARHAERLGVPPENVVFLGDAIHDLTARGKGTGVILHHREAEQYRPEPSDLVENAQYIVVGSDLKPFEELLLEMLKPHQPITVR